MRLKNLGHGVLRSEFSWWGLHFTGKAKILEKLNELNLRFHIFCDSSDRFGSTNGQLGIRAHICPEYEKFRSGGSLLQIISKNVSMLQATHDMPTFLCGVKVSGVIPGFCRLGDPS